MIYQVTAQDYPRLTDVWESSVRRTHDFLKQEDFEFYKSQMPVYFGSVKLFAYKDGCGEIRGFLGVAGDKLEMLFVDGASIGRGIGKSLLDFAVCNLKVRKLDVNEQNRQAVGFYEHQGFAVTGRSDLDGEGKNYPLLHMKLQ